MLTPLEWKAGAVSDSGSEERHRLLLDSIEDYAIYMLDCAGNVLTWNRGAEINKGYSREEIVGRNYRVFFVPEDIERRLPEQELAAALVTGRAAGEGWRLRKNGERFWASFVLTAMVDQDRRLVGFAKVTRDLTERKQQEDAMLAMDAALREERDRMHAVAESSMDALFICEAARDSNGQVEDFIFTYLNKNVESIMNMPRSAMLGRRMAELHLNEGSAERMEQYRRVVQTGEPFACEFPSRLGTNPKQWLRLQVVKLRDGLAITASDITLRKEFEERMKRMLEVDPLTGVLSRGVLQSRLQTALEGAREAGSWVGVLVLDLDAFKKINDTLGHAAGDQVLQTIALRLKGCVRAADQVIRMGGDEFVIILPDLLEVSEVKSLAERILASFEAPVAISGKEIQTSCSLGVAVAFGNGETAEALEQILSKADAAMYLAKSQGRNCIAWGEDLPVMVGA